LTVAASAAYAGLDLIATAVVLLDDRLRVVYVNPAAETLLAHSARTLVGQRFAAEFEEAEEFQDRLRTAIDRHWGFWDQGLTLTRFGEETLHLNCLATPVEIPEAKLLLELRRIDKRLRAEREERELAQSSLNRELIRNLAHEIKNPLGGLRGSAQLLERELDRADLREYTQVIIKEADRLQLLMDRLLTPHRPPHFGPVNIHEVLERVRSLILAEYPDLTLVRDYDTSLPDITGDREQLIQVVLNIVRNAAQALASSPPANGGEIRLTTRVARSVTIAKKLHRLALELAIADNGPGIPAALLDKVFHPLVSGRDGGTGLGLTLAQTYVQHHGGLVECESQPGHTVFRIILPLSRTGT
jgi:two-component system nitrogen regulation sensor histidine kinase GlnL